MHRNLKEVTKEDIEENILDSIFPLSFINKYESFADIGTGAGYPGLILAIAQRDVQSYLIEPRINNGTNEVFRDIEQASREIASADDEEIQ